MYRLYCLTHKMGKRIKLILKMKSQVEISPVMQICMIRDGPLSFSYELTTKFKKKNLSRSCLELWRTGFETINSVTFVEVEPCTNNIKSLSILANNG